MNSRRNDYPLILRREPFGGSLFDAGEACQIEFDHAAYDFLRDHLVCGREPTDDGQAALLGTIKGQLDLDSRRVTRVIDRMPPVLPGTLHLFSAPTIIDFQITGRCLQECPHCYAASSPTAGHVPYEQIIPILDQMRDLGVFQLALGGGEPLLHPDIIRILHACQSRGMVCNLTTSGHGLGLRQLIALKRYCGAVGLSLEAVGPRYALTRKSGFAAFEQTLRLLLKTGIRTVLQVTLSNENLADVGSIVDFCLTVPALYGVIFLAYKPAGRGASFRSPLSSAPSASLGEALSEAFARLSPVMRVGYDCCLSPALFELVAGGDKDVHGNEIEGCSALRGSVGITADLNVVPCTFLPDLVLGNLRETPLTDLFAESPGRSAFLHDLEHQRNRLVACRDCPYGSACLGGCPQMSLVHCSRMRERPLPLGANRSTRAPEEELSAPIP